MRRVYCKRYEDWSLSIQAKLRSANFGFQGKMLETVAYHNPITYVMLDRQELIGWALVAEQHDFGYCFGTNFVMFYVKSKHRRSGVGTRIAKRIRRDYKQVTIDPWNRVAHKFFEATGLMQMSDCY